MCQILLSHEANPPLQAIVDSNEMNKDGFGFAWVEGRAVKWRKGFSKDDLTDDLIHEYLDLPFPKAIHFRLATHGGVTPALTHPFPIKRGNPHDLTGVAKSVLFHNGVWKEYDDILREGILAGTLNPNVLKGGMSDSRAIAVLAQRYGEDFLDILDFGWNKVLILRGDDWYTYGSWTEKEGWSASNSKIFRVEPVERDRNGRYIHKGLGLDPHGFPFSKRGEQRPGGRSEDRGREVAKGEGRDMEPGVGLIGSYLSSERDEVEAYLRSWNQKGKLES